MTRWLALCAAAVLLPACSGDSGPEIRVGTVGRADVVEIVNAPATVTARAQSSVSSPAEGSVAEVFVADGERVRTGQPLLRISSPPARERLRQARAADAQAAAAVPAVSTPSLTGFQAQVDAAATAAFAAARSAAASLTGETRAAALAAVTQAEAQYATARAQALAALRAVEQGVGSLSAALASLGQAQRVQTRAAVTLAQATVDALTVRAPIGGVVQLGGAPSATSVPGGLADLVGALPESLQGALPSSSGPDSSAAEVVRGTPVTAGTPLATVFDLSSLSLVAAVDETDIFLVTKGVRAGVELDAVPDARYAATVVAVDLSPTESSRGGVTYRVRMRLGAGRHADGSPAPRPRPGMSAVADLRVRSASDAVAVPAAAIVRQGRRDAVWVVVGGRARARVVRLGAQGDDTVQVLDGVREGDRIVVLGADAVDEGDRVP
jgi:multidrug efflux pump subunit AcrA (membrane-fusion protein)